VEKAVLVQQPPSRTRREIQLFHLETTLLELPAFKQLTFNAHRIHKLWGFFVCLFYFKEYLDLALSAQFNAKMQTGTVKNIHNSLYC